MTLPQRRFLPQFIYLLLFSLLAMVYIMGLFVPLMDNDSAHHANIALHMYLTGDYVSLVDHAGDYLDKPHLHFWLAAFSYKIFGVTSFAYKLPSFLFTILWCLFFIIIHIHIRVVFFRFICTFEPYRQIYLLHHIPNQHPPLKD